MYLLDTNICIYLLNSGNPQIKEHFRSHSPSTIALCSIVKAELFFGARHSQKVDSNLRRLQLFFHPLASLPFDDRSAEEYGLIRSILTSQGKIIGPNDLLMAAIARAHDATLVTNNTKEFNIITNLRTENWCQRV